MDLNKITLFKNYQEDEKMIVIKVKKSLKRKNILKNQRF